MSEAADPIIDYPTNPDGSLLARGMRAGVPKLPANSPPPSAPGSVHWAATLIYGGPELFVQTVEAVVAGQGQLAERDWQRFCILYREWQKRFRAGDLKREPSLNDVAFALKLDTSEFFARLSTAIQSVYAKVASWKAIGALPQAIELTIAAMRDLENGGKDRETILRIGGVLADKPGFNVAISNNNQIGVRVDVKNELTQPLAQFRETIEEVDSDVRAGAVERAALPPADLTNVIDAEVVSEKEKELELAD